MLASAKDSLFCPLPSRPHFIFGPSNTRHNRAGQKQVNEIKSHIYRRTMLKGGPKFTNWHFESFHTFSVDLEYSLSFGVQMTLERRCQVEEIEVQDDAEYDEKENVKPKL